MSEEHLSSPQHFQQYLENFGTARIDQVTSAAIFRSLKKSERGVHDNEPRVFFNPQALLEDRNKQVENLNGNLEDLVNILNSLTRKTSPSEKSNALSLFTRDLPKLEGYIRDSVYLVKQLEAEINEKKQNSLRRAVYINEKPLKTLRSLVSEILFKLRKLNEMSPETTESLDFEAFSPFFELFSKEVDALQDTLNKKK